MNDQKCLSTNSLVGFGWGVEVSSYLLTSHTLDHKLGYSISNIIGLLISYVVGFILQFFIFTSREYFNQWLIGRYLVGIVIRYGVSVGLFFLVTCPVRKYYVFRALKMDNFTS